MMPIWMINVIKILSTIEFILVTTNLVSLIKDVLYCHKIIRNILITVIIVLTFILLCMIYLIH